MSHMGGHQASHLSTHKMKINYSLKEIWQRSDEKMLFKKLQNTVQVPIVIMKIKSEILHIKPFIQGLAGSVSGTKGGVCFY